MVRKNNVHKTKDRTDGKVSKADDRSSSDKIHESLGIYTCCMPSLSFDTYIAAYEIFQKQKTQQRKPS